MGVTNPGGAGGVSSPVNLVTAAAAIALANKLLAGDANNAFQILGTGEIDLGAGGAGALDTVIKRNAAGKIEVGDGNAAHDLVLGYDSVSTVNKITALANGLTVTTAAGDDINLNPQHNLVLNPNNLILLDNTIQNAVAGNEATTATAGANGDVPAQVVGYLIFQDHTGASRKLPYYAT